MTDIVVTHLGGLADFKINGLYTVYANDEGITFQTGTFRKKDFRTFRWDDSEIIAGTHEEIGERITLTRLAIAGPFAVLFKKKQQKHLITVIQGDELGLFEVASNSIDLYRTKIKQTAEIRQLQKKNLKTTDAAPLGDIEKFEKLAALLDKGLVTEEEFQQKKKQILENF